MKMVFIMFGEAINSEVFDILKQHSIHHYTKWTRVLGAGNASGPHLSSHIWPKGNNVLALAVKDNIAPALLESIRRLRAEHGSEGVKAFTLPIEEMT